MKSFYKGLTMLLGVVFSMLLICNISLAKDLDTASDNKDDNEIAISSNVYIIDMTNGNNCKDGYYTCDESGSLYIKNTDSAKVSVECADSAVYGEAIADDDGTGTDVEFYAMSKGIYSATVRVADTSFNVTVIAIVPDEINALKGDTIDTFISTNDVKGVDLESQDEDIVKINDDNTITAAGYGETQINVYVDFFENKRLITTLYAKIADPVLESDVQVIDITGMKMDDSGYYDNGSISFKVNNLSYIKDFSVVTKANMFSVQTDISGDTGYILLKPKCTGTFTVKINAGNRELVAKVAVITQADEKCQISLGKSYKMTTKGAGRLGKLVFKSSRPEVASIDDTGVVTSLASGRTNLYAVYYLNNRKVYTWKTVLTVTDASVTKDKVYINLFGETPGKDGYYDSNFKVSLKGVNENSQVKISSSNYIKCTYKYVSSKEKYILLAPKKTGIYTVSVSADGKTFKFTVYVANMHFIQNGKALLQKGENKWIDGSSAILLYKGESTTLRLSGVPKNCKAVYSVKDNSIAKVDSKGTVTGKKPGSTIVTATFGDIKVTYKVCVSYKQAVLAIRYAKNNFNATYSQSRRMEKGYYDCSSYVWRSYKAAGKYIGGSKTYAPTAAGICKWYADRGYVKYSGTVSVSKLLPGDLVFKCGANNGRYKGIYHVDLYQGNNSTLTVGRLKCFDKTMSNVIVVRLFK